MSGFHQDTGRRIKPKEYFEIDVKTFIDNPIVIDLPPEIVIDTEYMLATLESADEFDIAFNDLVNPISNVIAESNLFNNLFYRLKHKLMSLLYHIRNYSYAENIHIDLFKNRGEARRSDAYFEYKEPTLVYEIEAFLFQVKSGLDIIGQLIGVIFGWRSIKRYEDKGDIFVKMAKNNCSKDLKIHTKYLIEFICKHKIWTESLITMRDQITHFSDLKGLCCFITYFKEGNKAKIFYPIMPNGKTVMEYLNQTWINLLAFFNDFVLLFRRVTEKT